MDKETQIGVVIIAILSIILAIIIPQYKENQWEKKRILCNKTILDDGILSEQIIEGIGWSEDEVSVENAINRNKILERRLVNTNKEVNILRALIGCYFDE